MGHSSEIESGSGHGQCILCIAIVSIQDCTKDMQDGGKKGCILHCQFVWRRGQQV